MCVLACGASFLFVHSCPLQRWPVLEATWILYALVDRAYCKEPIPKIRNKFSQKRNCAATVPIFTFIVCERFIYSHDRSAYSPSGIKYVDRSWEYINRSRTQHMNVEIGTEAAQFPEKEYMNGIFVAVRVWVDPRDGRGVSDIVVNPILHTWFGVSFPALRTIWGVKKVLTA